MAKVRSPGYPVIGLGEAVEKISLVYKKDYQNRIPRSVVAQHMGYQGLNGKSMSVLASVSKYGLLDGRGEENWVSDLALQIIAHEVGSPERAAALTEASRSPELFKDIDARFPSGASDAALRSFLLTQKFIPQAAEIAARSYRETKQLVSSENREYPSYDQTKEESTPVADTAIQAIERTQAFQRDLGAIQQSGAAREYLRHVLSPDCEVSVLVKGRMTSRDLRKLRHLIYMSEVWEAETDSEKPKRADELEKLADEITKP